MEEKGTRTFVQIILHYFYAVGLRIAIITSKFWPIKAYLKFRYFFEVHGLLNLENPVTFNDKLNWLKINDRNPKYTMLADKYEVKKYVTSIIGEEFVVPCYGVYDNLEDIDYTKLPERFVIKTTHDSSGAFIVKDKNKIDINELAHKMRKSLSKNHYWLYREWPYKNIKPRIIVDKFLDDHTGNELRDYKFWCFGGVPKIMYCTNKGLDIFENFYDMDFKPVDINHGFKRNVPEFEKPKEFELMKSLAAKLSKDIPFVRVDFFDVDGMVYFGEFTFYDWGGFRAFEDGKWETVLGDWIYINK